MSLIKIIKQHSLEGFLALGILTGASTLPNNYSFGPKTAYGQELGEDETANIAHYLKNIDCPQDPVLRLFEKWRVYNSLSSKYPSAQKGINMLNESIVLKKDILGKEVTLTFAGYIKKENQVFRYTNDNIETLTETEFESVVNDQVQYIETAAKLAQEKFAAPYKKIMSTIEDTLKKQKKLGDNEKLEDFLKKDIPEYDGLKIRDVLFVPQEMSAKDFIPTHYFFTTMPRALGVTYLGTEIIAIDPKARILDYINGTPAILMHEMIHSNKKLEGFPLAMHFDAELWAEFPMLTDTDYLDFSFHSYLKDVRKMAKILFNFNSASAFEDVREYSLMFGTKLEDSKNYEKLRANIAITSRISETIQNTALNGVVPEFYTNPLYWITVNQFLHDDAAAFKIYFYKKFEPTCLGGPEETRRFMDSNKELVRESSQRVLRELNSEGKSPKVIILQSEEIKRDLKKQFEDLGPNAKQNLVSAAKQLGLGANNNPDDFIDFAIKLYEAGILDKNKIAQLKNTLKK